MTFGFCDQPFEIHTAKISVEPVAKFKSVVNEILSNDQTVDRWYYPPPACKGPRNTFVPRRIFGLPHTHSITCIDCDPERLRFLIWIFGFFAGMATSPDPNPFINSTPVIHGELFDRYCFHSDMKQVVERAEAFWDRCDNHKNVLRTFANVIHTLWMAQSKTLLHFESFHYAYLCIDASWKLTLLLKGITGNRAKPRHGEVVARLADEWRMPDPNWSKIVDLRNSLIHEADLMGRPLGAALVPNFKRTASNLPPEMCSFVMRIIVAALDIGADDYVRSSVSGRGAYRLFDAHQI